MNVSALLCEPHDYEDKDGPETPTTSSPPGSHLQDENEPTANATPRSGVVAMTATSSRPRVASSLPTRGNRQVVTLRVVPDKERKRSHRLSAKQRKQRLDFQTYESRVCNLTLDINELRQQVRFLEERRDLYVTRLLLAHENFQGVALELASSFVRVMQHEVCGSNSLVSGERDLFFARVDPLLSHPSAGGCDGVPGFVIREWDVCRQAFLHHTCVATSSRILAVLDAKDEDEDEDEDGYDADWDEEHCVARQVCGSGRACVVETTMVMSAHLTLPTVAAMAPRALQDEQWLTWLLEQRVSWNVTKRMYVNANALLAHQCGESDSFAVLGALFKADSRSIAATAAAALKTKLDARTSTAA